MMARQNDLDSLPGTTEEALPNRIQQRKQQSSPDRPAMQRAQDDYDGVFARAEGGMLTTKQVFRSSNKEGEALPPPLPLGRSRPGFRIDRNTSGGGHPILSRVPASTDYIQDAIIQD
ncbi:unnamed protein product [Calypogeia fissa]